jgi:hypothetical protein
LPADSDVNASTVMCALSAGKQTTEEVTPGATADAGEVAAGVEAGEVAAMSAALGKQHPTRRLVAAAAASVAEVAEARDLLPQPGSPPP